MKVMRMITLKSAIPTANSTNEEDSKANIAMLTRNISPVFSRFWTVLLT